MQAPEWVEAKFRWYDDPAWYKRLGYRMIILPIDRFYTWKYWKVDNKVADVQNAIMRVRKGHDWVDVWNMNSWFASNAVKILEAWINHPPMGHPVMNNEDGTEMTYEQWIDILNEMLVGFKLWDDYEGSGNWAKLDKPHENPDNLIDGKPACPHIGEGPSPSYWHEGAHYMNFDGVWTKCSMTTEEREKFKRSLFLFATYFENLWD